MCRFNLSLNDTIVEDMRPHFDGEKALESWMVEQLEYVMLEYMAQFRKSVVDNDRLLQRLQALDNSPEGFFELAGILGKPRKEFSWDELREDAYKEKYGI